MVQLLPLPKGANGGRGKQRLAATREILLQRLITEAFTTPQKRSAAALSLFSAIDELREIERKSEAFTRTARRNRARRKNNSVNTENASTPAKRPAEIASIGSVRPFEDIEPW